MGKDRMTPGQWKVGERAYKRGWNAGLAKEPATANPYERWLERTQWVNGRRDALKSGLENSPTNALV